MGINNKEERALMTQIHHSWIPNDIIIIGELFFITLDGIKKNDPSAQRILSSLYDSITFN